MKKLSHLLIQKRMFILIFLSAAVYVAISKYNVSLLYIMIAGMVLGVIFGKVFCRWACPLGLMMEMMMKMNPSGMASSMYQYHKLGCPIAWVSGFLNKFSFFKIDLAHTCTSCGKCDKTCYMVELEPEKFSFYKEDKQRPGDNYSCSRCLECVDVCPNGSLSYTPKRSKKVEDLKK